MSPIIQLLSCSIEISLPDLFTITASIVIIANIYRVLSIESDPVQSTTEHIHLSIHPFIYTDD